MKTLKHAPLLILLLMLWLMLWPGSGAAENNMLQKKLEIIELQHRNASEVLPVIKPLLANDERLSASRNQLVIRASSATIDEVKRIVSKLDKPLRMLNITVRYSRRAQNQQHEASLSGSAGIKYDAQKKETEPKVNINTKITSTTSNEHDISTQNVQVIEGNWASIHTGQLTPETSSSVNISGFNTSIQTRKQYRKSGSGFRVKPVIRKDHVVLHIMPLTKKSSGIDRQQIQSISASTQITGRLGTWIELGGISNKAQSTPSARTYSTKKSFTDDSTIQVKVEEIK